MVEHLDPANETLWLVVRNVATEVVQLVSAKIDDRATDQPFRP